MTSAAMNLHDELVGQGFDADSDDYYNEIDKRLKDYFPSKFRDAEETSDEELVTEKSFKMLLEFLESKEDAEL